MVNISTCFVPICTSHLNHESLGVFIEMPKGSFCATATS